MAEEKNPTHDGVGDSRAAPEPTGHPGLSIALASLFIGLAVFVLEFVLVTSRGIELFVAGHMTAHSLFGGVAGLGMFAGIFVAVVGALLGCVGIYQAEQKKQAPYSAGVELILVTLGVIGVGINLVAVSLPLWLLVEWSLRVLY